MLTPLVAAFARLGATSAPTAASVTASVRMGRLFPSVARSNAVARPVLLRSSMTLRRSDKRALVAGGTGRVGSAIVERLGAEGWQVVAAGRRDADLRHPEGSLALVASAVAGLGGLDLVVHAAGAGFEPTALEEVTEELWDEALDVTAKGTFFLAQAAAPALRESRGVLVIIEDVAAFQPWTSFPAHSAAKAAQAMLT